MKKALLPLCLLVNVLCFSQANFTWVKTLGNNDNDYATDIASDSYGNVYTAGYFTGTVDFDPGVNSFPLSSGVGVSDIYILKLDSLGDFIWAKQITGTNSQELRRFKIDNLGNLVITGIFNGTTDFDPSASNSSLTAVSGFDAFICKWTSDGDFVWANKIGGSGQQMVTDLVIDPSNNHYITGSFNGTTDFDPSAGTFDVTADVTNYFVGKYDENGAFIWQKNTARNVQNAQSTCITLDVNGNIITSGYFNTTGDFDPSANTLNLSPTSNTNDIFISKLNSIGDLVWVKQYGGTGNDVANSIVTDNDGNIYSIGNFTGLADFDPSSGTFDIPSGGSDIFISKLDSTGNFMWAKNMGGGQNYGNHICIDSDNNLIYTGLFTAPTDFDPSSNTNILTPIGANDSYLAKMNENGEVIFTQHYGSPGNYSSGNKVTTDIHNNILLAGIFQGNVDFDFSSNQANVSTINSNYDAFILKLGQSNATNSITESVSNVLVHIYPSPAKDFLTIDTQEAIEKVEIYSESGQIVKTATSAEFSVVDLQTGIYIAHITTETGKTTTRFIKE